MKNIFLLCICIASYETIFAQENLPIKFIAHYTANRNIIRIEIQNSSSSKTYYFMVGVKGLVDTGQVRLVTDIKSLGQNEFIDLEPIGPHKRVIKFLAKKKISNDFPEYNIKKLIFFIEYFKGKDFRSESKVIWLSPI
jgi:hypothetical protein